MPVKYFAPKVTVKLCIIETDQGAIIDLFNKKKTLNA
jgi:hypothetical protein